MQNTTGLSFAGLIKWICILSCAVFLYKSYQGLIQQEIATGGGRSVGEYLTGDEAVRFGLECLGTAAGFGAAAWAVWFFWQRNEE